jgi:hypothetical protein
MLLFTYKNTPKDVNGQKTVAWSELGCALGTAAHIFINYKQQQCVHNN